MNTSHNVYPVRYGSPGRALDDRQSAQVEPRISLCQRKFAAAVEALGAIDNSVVRLQDAARFCRLEGATGTGDKLNEAARNLDDLHAAITTMLARALNIVDGMNRGRAQ